PAVPGTAREEILQQILFAEPKAPRQLDRTIPHDLETIVLKAMAQEPEARYVTAKETADDIRCWLQDRPIQARRPTLPQRGAKWARRHLAAVVSAAVLSFLIAVGLAVSTIVITKANTREIAARAQAQANYSRAEAERTKAEDALAREAEERHR